MSWLSMLGIAAFSALCWGHGYSRARMMARSNLSDMANAYLRGRLDERADQRKDPLP